MYLNNFLSCGSFSDDISIDFINLERRDYLPMDIVGCMILANYGVCRHTSDLLSHIYDYFHYDNAILIIYQSNLDIEVINNGNQFLTNRHIQEYVEQALDGFDLFSQEQIHDSKEYGEIEVKINFLPSADKKNHAVNIVKSKKNKE